MAIVIFTIEDALLNHHFDYATYFDTLQEQLLSLVLLLEK